jgi:predicted transposase YbfD/YdcC
VLPDRLAEGGSLKGAIVSIDAVATNARIARTIKDKGAGYLLAIKANQPALRKETQAAFAAAGKIDMFVDRDRGHGRIEQRTVSVINEVDWLDGERRFPGKLRLPHAATLIRVQSPSIATAAASRRAITFSPAEVSAKQAEGRARPQGRREPTPLDARRRLRRRPIPPAQRSRRQKHVPRQTLRDQPRPHRSRIRKTRAYEAAT